MANKPFNKQDATCITQINAALGGKLTPRQAASIYRRVRGQALLVAKQEGIPPQTAMMKLAMQADVTRKAIKKQIQANKVAQLVQARKILQRTTGLLGSEYKSPLTGKTSEMTAGKALESYMIGIMGDHEGGRNSVEAKQEAAFMQTYGRFMLALEEAGVAREWTSNIHEADIRQELAEFDKPEPKPGISGNKTAAFIAGEMVKTGREKIALLNQNGAWVRELPGWASPQTHDRLAFLKAGKDGRFSTPDKERGFQKWMAFVRPRLDEVRTFRGDDAVDFLREVHNNIWNGEPADSGILNDDFAVGGGIASKASQHRILHFKTWQDEMAYNQAFGTKTLSEAFTKSVRDGTHMAIMMREFGANYEKMIPYVVRELKAAVRDRADSARQIASLDSNVIEYAHNKLTGNYDVTSNPQAANFVGKITDWISASALGGTALLTAFTDHLFIADNAAFNGASKLDAYGSYIKAASGGLGREARAELRRLGVGMKGLLGSLNSRYSMHEGGGFTHKMTSFLYRWTGVEHLTDAGYEAGTFVLMHDLGSQAERSYEKLKPETQRLLRQYGFSPLEWPLLAEAVKTVDGDKMLVAGNWDVLSEASRAKLMQATGEASWVGAKRAMDAKLGVMAVDQAGISVPTPGVRETSLLHLGTNPQSMGGLAMTLLTQYKSFPLSITNKFLGRTLSDPRISTIPAIFRISSTLAAGFASAYALSVVKDLLDGKTHRSFLNPDKATGVDLEYMSEIMRLSGLGGIIGDLLLNQYDNDLNQLVDQMAGPAIGRLGHVATITSRTIWGQKNPFDPEGTLAMMRAVKENVPFGNVVVLKQALNHFFWYSLQEYLNPDSLRRQEESLRNRTGQEYLPGRSPGDHYPLFQ